MAAEVYALLGMTAAGACIGILFDLLHTFGKSLSIPESVTDAVFWLAAIAAAAAAFVYFGRSIIRGYEVIGALIGTVLYFLTISRLLKRCFMCIFEFFFKKIKFIFKILLTPLHFFYKMVHRKSLIHFKHGRKHKK